MEQISLRVGTSGSLGANMPTRRRFWSADSSPADQISHRVGILRGPVVAGVRFCPHDGDFGPCFRRLRIEFPIVWANARIWRRGEGVPTSCNPAHLPQRANLQSHTPPATQHLQSRPLLLQCLLGRQGGRARALTRGHEQYLAVPRTAAPNPRSENGAIFESHA